MTVQDQLKRNRSVRIALLLIGLLAGGVIAFYIIPEYTVLEIKHVISLITPSAIVWMLFGDRIKNKLTDIVTPHNVAEIELRGPIKEGIEEGPFGKEAAIPSRRVVKRIKKCAKKDYDALIINIDSPGGYPVPSDDIRRALENVDLPTYTYITNLCASGGYMIACGTDWIHARQDSLVGSIGVIANQYKFSGLADKLGIGYERFVGGDHKDTHQPLKELDEEERDYWQSVIDKSYENFVQVVADSRDLSPEKVKATKAEVFDGTTALGKGLVDHVGPRRELTYQIKADTGIGELKIRRYDGTSKVWGSVEAVLASMAYAFGHGLSAPFSQRTEKRLEYRI